MRTLTVAFWPELKKIGCARIQRQLKCDPSVAGFFPAEMVTMDIPNSPVYIWKATEAEWRKMARDWARIDHRDSAKWVKGLWVH